jgi:hypothetical protein
MDDSYIIAEPLPSGKKPSAAGESCDENIGCCRMAAGRPGHCFARAFSGRLWA